MRLTIYGLFLLIFKTGYVFAVVHRDCGGTIDILRERSGYIWYSSPAGQVDSNSVTCYNETEQSETECTWIIDARPDQKVQLEIVSIDNVSSLWAHFENSGEQRVFAQKESSPFSGDGRTRITWKAKKYSDTQQSVNLFFTGRTEIRNSLEEGRGESARTAHPEHGESSSPHISGAPRVRRKSWPPASSGPALHREGSAHHTEGPGGQGLGHGTVGAFPSLTSAPALGQSSSASAASDKEAPPLLQETSNNNPDTSGAARGASHITAAPGLSTKGNGRGTTDPTGQRLQIWATEPEPEPEAHRFLEVSVDYRGRVTVGPPPKQDPDAVFQGPLTEPETKLAVLPPSRSAAGSAIPISVLPAISPTVSPKIDPPGSMQQGQPADRNRGARVGNPHISALPLHHPPSSASHPSGEVDPPSLTSPVDYPAALTPSDSNSPTVYLTTALSEDPWGKDYTHRDYGLHSISPLPGEGKQDVTGKQSVSNVPSSSTLGLSQEWKVLPHTGGTIGKGSWRVTDMDPPGSSLPEDTTYFDIEQGSHLDGTTVGFLGSPGAEGSFRLSSLVTRSLLEDKSSDVPLPDVSGDVSPLPGSTHMPGATVSLDSLDSITTEGLGNGADAVSIHSEAASVSAHVGSDSQTHVSTFLTDSDRPNAATVVPELGDVTETKSTLSPPCSSVDTHSSVSVDQNFTGTLTERPGVKGSASTSADDSRPRSVSVTSVPWPERNTDMAHESGSSDSTPGPPVSGDRDKKDSPAVSTAPVTSGPQRETSTSEGIASASPAHGTPDHFLQGATTAPHVLTTSLHLPHSSQGTRGTEILTENGWRAHSERLPTGTDEPVLYSFTLSPGPVDFDPATSLTSVSVSPSVTPATVWLSPGASTTGGNSVSPPPGQTPATPPAPEGPPLSGQGETEGTPKVHYVTTLAPGRTSRTLVNLGPSMTTQLTTKSPSRTTHKTPAPLLPLTPWPSLSPQTTGHLLPPRDDLSPSTVSTQPATGRAPSAPSTPMKPVRGRVFIMEDQPVIIKEETVQLLLQMVLDCGKPEEPLSPLPGNTEEDAAKNVGPFLERAPGYERIQDSWTSGSCVMQTVSVFDTGRALSWLGVPGGLLDVTGLKEAVRRGSLHVGGTKVLNITVGGLQTELCSWLFLCPAGFQCVPNGLGNASCTSLCHTDHCKNGGICTHHQGQQPMCQCPVGEDFWYMGRRCDLRMTRQRLVGVCLGILLFVALVMAVLCYLAIRRFKAMLIQAKVDQTRSSYRRFNHFDELSGRFWLRSWPGSADSLDNPAFTRSDELLHLRALDRTCCYHDDTLSIASTYPGSGTHLNTVYAHGSQYNWNLSDGSINDWIADSGKASDLSVCSWPIEPIQWTPFPILQQLGVHRSVKTPRPHSYCEGMELVDLEKTWTA